MALRWRSRFPPSRTGPCLVCDQRQFQNQKKNFGHPLGIQTLIVGKRRPLKHHDYNPIRIDLKLQTCQTFALQD